MKKLLVLLVLLAPGFANAQVLINEVAWMGTEISANDEWIELYNNGDESVDLSGWVLSWQGGNKSVELSGSIEASDFYLLERTDDESVAGITADLIYTGALSNSGEDLLLVDASGVQQDKVEASDSWPAGDNASKNTMQRTNNTWATYPATPKTINSGQSAEAKEPVSSSGLRTKQRGLIIDAIIGEDLLVNVGTRVTFDAQIVDQDDNDIRGGSYHWNLGDGSHVIGKSVTHIYENPGTYVAVLEVELNNQRVLKRQIVEVVPLEVDVVLDDGLVKITNKSKHDADLGGFTIKQDRGHFSLPKNSLLLPGKSIYINQGVLGFDPGLNALRLEYPNGRLAMSHRPEGAVLGAFYGHDERLEEIRLEIERLRAILESLKLGV